MLVLPLMLQWGGGAEEDGALGFLPLSWMIETSSCLVSLCPALLLPLCSPGGPEDFFLKWKAYQVTPLFKNTPAASLRPESEFLTLVYKALDGLALALFSRVPSSAVLLEPPAPATRGFFLSFHKEGRKYPPLCVFVHATSYSCDSPSSTLRSLLISCISVRYRLKCHLFQKALPEPTVLSGPWFLVLCASWTFISLISRSCALYPLRPGIT